MTPDNKTLLKYIIMLSTSFHVFTRQSTISRQTPARLIPKVGAALIQHLLDDV